MHTHIQGKHNRDFHDNSVPACGSNKAQWPQSVSHRGEEGESGPQESSASLGRPQNQVSLVEVSVTRCFTCRNSEDQVSKGGCWAEELTVLGFGYVQSAGVSRNEFLWCFFLMGKDSEKNRMNMLQMSENDRAWLSWCDIFLDHWFGLNF